MKGIMTVPLHFEVVRIIENTVYLKVNDCKLSWDLNRGWSTVTDDSDDAPSPEELLGLKCALLLTERCIEVYKDSLKKEEEEV
jgi:hypothetical protein